MELYVMCNHLTNFYPEFRKRILDYFKEIGCSYTMEHLSDGQLLDAIIASHTRQRDIVSNCTDKYVRLSKILGKLPLSRKLKMKILNWIY